ncbi:hypothetical protein BJ138DRAFT_1164665 [Hygrophoropsis aurantiaca]|uniref:Uncharacterized protein n=1 Tax=Hygrophoropsis aurantiaca TaxID=72124 RepID=A0ACB7ZWU2_9AGAM|nr:hypothetical protein BJ138DRAFT_1164665 [Hygrophoropsis aurantiaca]
MALKLSWRRLGNIDTINNVEEKIRGLLKEHDIGVITSERSGCPEPDNVLQQIRGFTGDSEQIIHLGLEERLLNADLLELKRPVRFFWSIQDFVMGVSGALLGHKWLVDHGILHRGVSEDNIALARRPWERQRGYITNFDNAINYEQKDDAAERLALSEQLIMAKAKQIEENHPAPQDAEKEIEEGDSAPSIQKTYAENRTVLNGLVMYMSINVLYGSPHCTFDDVESFFYVLLMFIFSYNRPVERADQLLADTRGFTSSGSGQSNLAAWPDYILAFSSGTFETIADAKKGTFERHFAFTLKVERDLRDRWGTKVDVAHGPLVAVIDKWLDEHAVPTDGCNQCPFEDPRTGAFAV